VAGLVILAAGAASIWRLATERRIKETLLWVILFFFAPFNALMTGIGRLGYGVKIAATSRYQSVTAITLIATIVLVLAALPTGAVSRRAARLRNIAFGALLSARRSSPSTGPMSPTIRRATSGKWLPKSQCGRGSKAISISKP
jgi:hypothetical protein